MVRIPRLVLIPATACFLAQAPLTADAKDPAAIKPRLVKKPAVAVKSARPDLVVSKINDSPGSPTTGSEHLPAGPGTTGGTWIGGETWRRLSGEIILTENDVYVMTYGKVQIQLKYEYREYNNIAVKKTFKRILSMKGRLGSAALLFSFVHAFPIGRKNRSTRPGFHLKSRTGHNGTVKQLFVKQLVLN